MSNWLRIQFFAKVRLESLNCQVLLGDGFGLVRIGVIHMMLIFIISVLMNDLFSKIDLPKRAFPNLCKSLVFGLKRRVLMICASHSSN